MNIAYDMINIILKHDQFTQLCIGKLGFYFFYCSVTIDSDYLFSWYKTLTDLYFWKFLCIFQQLGISLLLFFINILLKQIFISQIILQQKLEEDLSILN